VAPRKRENAGPLVVLILMAMSTQLRRDCCDRRVGCSTPHPLYYRARQRKTSKTPVRAVGTAYRYMIVT
jgi:hypothetical protein